MTFSAPPVASSNVRCETNPELVMLAFGAVTVPVIVMLPSNSWTPEALILPTFNSSVVTIGKIKLDPAVRLIDAGVTVPSVGVPTC